VNERTLQNPLSHPTSLAHALHRWLALLGARRELDEVRECCLERRELVELAQRCAGNDVDVRAVEVTRSAIASLRLPALLPLRDGSVALLRTVGPLRAELEDGADQRTIMSRAELLARCVGVAIEELPTPRGANNLLHGWLQVLRRERRRTIEVVALSALLPMLGLLGPLLAGQALDGAISDGAARQLLWLAFGCFLAAVFQGWLGYLRQRVLLALDARVQTTAMREAFTRLLARPYLEVCGLSLGEQARPTDSAQRVTQAPAEFIFAPLLDLLLVIGYALGLCFMSWSAPDALIRTLPARKSRTSRECVQRGGGSTARVSASRRRRCVRSSVNLGENTKCTANGATAKGGRRVTKPAGCAARKRAGRVAIASECATSESAWPSVETR
jgi:ABC-type bacteriocin/lantibiotic exporter with double-glycine peptidase domain